MPISSSERRSGIGDSMRMIAPKVPASVGAGMNIGRLARTPWRCEVM